jgi:hypothetical protein
MYFYLLSKSESSPRLSCIEREAFRLEITKGMVLYSVQVESISTAHLTPPLMTPYAGLLAPPMLMMRLKCGSNR